MSEIEGYTSPGFAGVREAFAANFAAHGEIGAAVAVYRHGRLVVDLWGGVADPTTGRPWDRRTLQVVMSTTKGVVAGCAHLLAQRGELDLDAPVAQYWPEFAAAGKDGIPVRWLLTHQAGLPVLDTPLTPDQAIAWEPAVAALARQRPAWEPGTRAGYHAMTYGWLVGEVVRRASGRTVGRFLAEEIAGPLGLDLFIGLPAREHGRMSRLVEAAATDATLAAIDLDALPEPVRAAMAPWTDPDSLTVRAMLKVVVPPLDLDDPTAWAAEIPSANGIATARGLAGFYAALIGEVDGHRILDAEHLAAATAEQFAGTDAVLNLPARAATGFGLPLPGAFWHTPSAFGTTGRGGSIGFADPAGGLAFGYVMNHLVDDPRDPRAANLVAAVREATG